MTQKTSSLPEVISIGDLVADVIVAVPQLPAVAGQHQIAREVNLEPGGGCQFFGDDGSVGISGGGPGSIRR
jgi:hypothetical protein